MSLKTQTHCRTPELQKHLEHQNKNKINMHEVVNGRSSDLKQDVPLFSCMLFGCVLVAGRSNVHLPVHLSFEQLPKPGLQEPS